MGARARHSPPAPCRRRPPSWGREGATWRRDVPPVLASWVLRDEETTKALAQPHRRTLQRGKKVDVYVYGRREPANCVDLLSKSFLLQRCAPAPAFVATRAFQHEPGWAGRRKNTPETPPGVLHTFTAHPAASNLSNFHHRHGTYDLPLNTSSRERVGHTHLTEPSQNLGDWRLV